MQLRPPRYKLPVRGSSNKKRIETRHDEVIAWRNNLSEEDRDRGDLQRDFRLAKETFKQKNMCSMLTPKMSFWAEKLAVYSIYKVST